MVVINNDKIPKYLGLSGHALVTSQTLLIGLPSFVLFGYNQSGMGGALSLPEFGKYFPMLSTLNKEGSAKSQASTLQGVFVSTFSLGALLGAAFCSFFGDHLGRKKTILLGAILVLIGEILECSAFNIGQLCTGRTILGVGIGILNVSVPTWQSECSKPKNRGKHVALDGAFISLGYLLTNWISFGFYMGNHSQATWRVPIAIGAIFNFPLIFAIIKLPESPRWLIMKGRVGEAQKVLASINEREIEDDIILQEIENIEIVNSQSTQADGNFKELFKMGEDKLLMRFLMCMALQCLQQMSGGNLISVYSTTLYEESLEMSGELSRILASCTMTFKFLCGFIAFFTVDRYGRRLLLTISGSGMALCMLFLAVTTSQPDNFSANIASVFFIFAFNFFIPIGFLGINWLYVTEISPTKYRTYISSILSANNWIWNFVVTMITPVAIQSIAYRYYIIYAVIGALIPIMVLTFFPETLGLELEAIDVIFKKSSSPWTVVKTAKKERKTLLSSDLSQTKELRSQLQPKPYSEQHSFVHCDKGEKSVETISIV